MKHINASITALGLCVLTSAALAQPTHQSVVHNQAGSSASTVNGVARDAQGNMIITGWRSDALDFGGTAHAGGQGAIFLAKFDPQGNELWSKVSGSTDMLGNHKGMGVAVDPSGNIYNCGWVFVAQQADFDGTLLPLGTLGYVAKYDPNGTLLWVKDFGAGIHSIAVDSQGYPFINLGDQTVNKLDPSNGTILAGAPGGGDQQNVLYHNIVINANDDVFVQWGNRIVMYSNSLLLQPWSTPITKPIGAETYRITVDFQGGIWASFYVLIGTVTLGGVDYSGPAGYIYRLTGTAGAVFNCTSPGAYKIKEVHRYGLEDLYAAGTFGFNAPAVVKYDFALNTIWTAPSYDVEDMEFIADDCLLLGGRHAADITLNGTTYPRPNGSGQDNAIAGFLCANGVGMDEQHAQAGLSVFPNPASSTLSVRSAVRGAVRITSATGQLVVASNAAGPVTDLDISGLSPGLYLLHDAHGDVVRFVVERRE